MEKIKEVFSKNLLALRKNKKLTQLELAKALNYSDKSISKWETGETVPDIEALKNIAVFFDTTVDYLINEHNENEIVKKEKTADIRKRRIIVMLYVSIVWIAATIMYVQLNILRGQNEWTLFIWSVPVSCFIIMILNIVWLKQKYSMIISSVFVWTVLAAMYIEFISYNIWVIFFVGVPLQIANILFYQLKSK